MALKTTKQNVLFLRTKIAAGDESSSSFRLLCFLVSLVCEWRGCTVAAVRPGGTQGSRTVAPGHSLSPNREIEKVQVAGTAASAQWEETGSSLGGLPLVCVAFCKINALSSGGSIFCFFPSGDPSPS